MRRRDTLVRDWLSVPQTDDLLTCARRLVHHLQYKLAVWRLRLVAQPSPFVDQSGVKVAEEIMAIQPFRIDVNQIVLGDLKRRLEKTRITPGTAEGGWDCGMRPAYLDDLCEYPVDQVSWKAGADGNRTHQTSCTTFHRF